MILREFRRDETKTDMYRCSCEVMIRFTRQTDRQTDTQRCNVFETAQRHVLLILNVGINPTVQRHIV